jgi:hypothetical protein
MDSHIFRMYGQRSSDGKMVLTMVVDEEEFFGSDSLPNQFFVTGVRVAPTIYTGTYPTIKMDMGTVEDASHLAGQGIAGILTDCNWACETVKHDDKLGIGISGNKNG